MRDKIFLDSNIVLYLLSSDVAKAEKAEELLAAGATISVQVLNEVTNVARRKLAMSWPDVRTLLEAVRRHCRVEPLSVDSHELGLRAAERYGLSVYDAMIVGSALAARCTQLYSEDMQDGQYIEQTLRITNPFHKTQPHI